MELCLLAESIDTYECFFHLVVLAARSGPKEEENPRSSVLTGSRSVRLRRLVGRSPACQSKSQMQAKSLPPGERRRRLALRPAAWLALWRISHQLRRAPAHPLMVAHPLNSRRLLLETGRQKGNLLLLLRHRRLELPHLLVLFLHLAVFFRNSLSSIAFTAS